MRTRPCVRLGASLLAVAITSIASAQNQSAWLRTFGTGDELERPIALRIDAQGSVIVGGSIVSLATAYDFLVLKYDGAGNLQWSRTFDESGESDYIGDVQVDVNGDVYVTGETRSVPIVFRMGLFRYDPDGTLLWSRFSAPPGATARGRALSLDGVGGVHVAGSTSGPGAGCTFWKYDSAGNEVWQTTATLPGVYPVYFSSTLLRDSTGSLIAAAAAFEGSKIPLATAKVDAAGNMLWMRTFQPPNSEEVYPGGLALGANDDVYVAGAFTTETPGSPFDAFLAKYDAAGVLQWSRIVSGVANFSDMFHDVAVDAHGDIVVAGSLSTADSTFGAHLRKYDAAGNLLWSRTYDPTPYTTNSFNRIALDDGGDIVAVGTKSNGFGDMILQRYDASGALKWATVYTTPADEVGGQVAFGASGSIFVTTDASANIVTRRLEPLTSVYCFGDGSGTACPCANSSTPFERAGCLNSLGTAGRLHDTGVSSLSGDSLRLSAAGMTNSSALYFQGTGEQNGGAGTVFGDGLRCAGGTNTRLVTRTNVAGASSYPGVGEPSLSQVGNVTSPGVRTYQIWYRNSAAFCTAATANLTNGVRVTWIP